MAKITQQDILTYISESSDPVTRNELARAFQIKGDDRKELKDLLRHMEDSGLLVRQSGKYRLPKGLPQVQIVEITDVDVDGDLIARPVDWNEEEKGPAPRIEVAPDRARPAAGVGDRILARLSKSSGHVYTARTIKRLDTPQNRVIGLIENVNGRFVLRPTDKKAKYDFDLAQNDLNGARPGDLAVAEIQPSRGMRNKRVRIVNVVGNEQDPKAISLIAIHEAGLRTEFSEAVQGETKNMTVPDLKGRKDLRQIPLVTIDGADARDFDDAVWAEKTDNGFNLIVAIADVSYYVRPGMALDREAYLRGNSTYFPDRVVPMLPEALSNDLCSLRPNENRACVFVKMSIDNDGKLKSFKFDRGLMRSVARLTYEQVQAARDGNPDDVTGSLMKTVIDPLYEAYEILWKAREQRGALDLDLPERKILVDASNNMTGVTQRVRLDSHKLIEEFMILANVAAASALEKRTAPCAYRVHDKPDPLKMGSAAEFIKTFGISLPQGNVTHPKQLNKALQQAAKHEYSKLINEVILRAQSQAHYSPENSGHFGLSLERYAHFTSPIRRYSDLLVHRSLVSAFNLGPGGLNQEQEARLSEMTDHISKTERVSAEAERSAVDRFTAAFLSEQVGAEFKGRIRGVTRFGLFVELKETGADGFIPMRTLPHDHYIHDEHQHALIGERSGRVYRLGAEIDVKLRQADPLTGSTILSVVGDQGADIPGYELKPVNRSRVQTGAGSHGTGKSGKNRKQQTRTRGRRFDR